MKSPESIVEPQASEPGRPTTPRRLASAQASTRPLPDAHAVILEG
jgi:hypothetical protein